MKPRNLTGQHFGNLVAIEKVPSRKGKSRWKCQCECGNITIVTAGDLTSGNTTSCGCKLKEAYHKNGIRLKKHGMCRTRLYTCWCDMKRRCTNPKNSHFKDYGGRGIKVCEEWNNSTNFIEWALNNGYREELTLDRIDVNGNYEPSNCRWITIKEQANNTRRNINVEINGETHNLTEWARITGINIQTLRSRYHSGDRGKRLIRKVGLESYDTRQKRNDKIEN